MLWSQSRVTNVSGNETTLKTVFNHKVVTYVMWIERALIIYAFETLKEF